MNWGHKLTLGIVAFMGFIIFLVVSTSLVSTDLVTDDYYEQELKYQDRIDAEENTAGLNGEFVVSSSGDMITIQLPSDFYNLEVIGSAHFYRPDNADLDRLFKLRRNSLELSVPKSKFKSGTYVLKISCEVDGKDYYHSEELSL